MKTIDLKKTIVLLVLLALGVFFIAPDLFPLESLRGDSAVFLVGGDSESPIEVRIRVTPKDLNNEVQQASIEIEEIVFVDQNAPENAEVICVHSLNILVAEYSRTWFGVETHRFLPENSKLCKSFTAENISSNSIIVQFLDQGSELIPLSENLYLENDSFYYPYDAFNIQIASLVTMAFLDSDGNLIDEIPTVANLLIDVEGGSKWDRVESPATNSDSFWKSWPIDNYSPLILSQVKPPLTIRFSRPLMVRVIFPISIFSFLALIYLITRVDSLDTFLNGSIAVLVGLFGIREVLIPADISTRTIVDALVMCVYFAFAVSVFLRAYKLIFLDSLEKKVDLGKRWKSRLRKRQKRRGHIE